MKRKVSILLALIMAVTIWTVPGGAFATDDTKGLDEELVVSLSSDDDIVYNCEAQEPELIVKDKEGNDIDIDDCDVEYSDNVNAGTATATVKYGSEGDSVKTGTLEFIINPADLSNGNAEVYVDPEITVFCNGEELLEGKDYVVSGSDQPSSVKNRLKIRGIGNYTGVLFAGASPAVDSVLREGEDGQEPTVSETTTEPVPLPEQVTGLKVKERTTSSVTLTWNKVNDAEGYRVYRYSSEGRTLLRSIKGNSTVSVTITGRLSAATYTFGVAAYNSENKNGTVSKHINVNTKVRKTTIKTLTPKFDKSITVKWKSVRGTGYQVQIAKKKTFSKKSTVKKFYTTKTKTVQKKALKKNTRYFVRVRAYRKLPNGQKMYGPWSAYKSVKTKYRNGWYSDSKGYKYYYDKGEKLTGEETLTSDSTKFKYYYFDKDGVFRGFSKEGWKQINGVSSRTKYAVCVSRSLCRYVIYTKKNGTWTPYKYGLCGPGRKAHKTPTFNTYACGTLGKWKQEKRLHFGDPDGYRCWYFTRVRNTIGFHSVKYRVGSKSRLQQPLYEQIGRTVSHGCIRLSISDASWVYKNIWKGTRVIVVDDDTKAERGNLTI